MKFFYNKPSKEFGVWMWNIMIDDEEHCNLGNIYFLFRKWAKNHYDIHCDEWRKNGWYCGIGMEPLVIFKFGRRKA